MASMELKALLFYIAIMTALALAGAAAHYIVYSGFNPGAARYVENYNATLDPSTMRLTEEVTYKITSLPIVGADTHMLYRHWDTPLTLPGNDTGQPHVQLLSIICPANTIGYMITHEGKPVLLEETRDNTFVPPSNPEAHVVTKEQLARLAHINPSDIEYVHDEAGCIFPHPVTSGVYTVTYTFQLVPPLTTNATHSYTSILLAGADHLPYNTYTLTIEPAESVEEAFITPPGSGMDGQTIRLNHVLHGIRLDLLLKTKPPGTLEPGDPGKRYRDETRAMATLAATARTAPLAGIALLAAIPLIVVSTWYLAGREPIGEQPSIVVEPPANLKPWQASALANPKLTPGPRGFIATILDLARRRIIEYDPGTNTIKRTGETRENLDFYERGVLSFIEEYQEQRLHERKPSRLRPPPLELRRLVRDLEKRAREAMEEAVQGTGPRGKLLALASAGSLALIATGAYIRYAGGPPLTTPAALAIIIGILLLGDALTLYYMPKWLMGRLKPEYRKALAQLEAYKRFLNQLATTAQNTLQPQTATIHLAYAASLGLEKRKIHIIAQTLGIASLIPLYDHANQRYARTYRASSGGGLGGGGGGFGGGGAGAR